MDLDDVDDCPPCPQWYPDKPASEGQDKTTTAETEAFGRILASLKKDLAQKDFDDRYSEAQMLSRDTNVQEPESESESESESEVAELVPGPAGAIGSDKGQQIQADRGEVEPADQSG